MLIFHEGLPGSGKSYEAVIERIVPALKKGRAVQAYIEGLDVDKLAELAGRPREEVAQLVTVWTRAQLQTRDENLKLQADHLPELALDNSLIVLDEAQNFWGNREKLGPAITQFITEHRHRGIDLVLMGQDLRDVHAVWRRRVEVKAAMLKLTAFGTSKRYSVTTFRHLGGDQWTRVGLQLRKYDPRAFGAYASHVAEDTNTADYQDARSSIWSSKALRYGVPLAVVAALVGLWHVVAFFSGDTGFARAPGAASSPAASGAPVVQRPTLQGGQAQAGPRAPAPAAPAAPPPRSLTPQERRFTELSAEYRIRLAGLVESADRVAGVVEWIDGGSRVVERLTLDTLRDLGVAIVRGPGTVTLALGQWSDLATMWPLESPGAVSQNGLERIRGAQPQVAPAPAVSLGGQLARPTREPAVPMVTRGERPPSQRP